MRCGLLPRLAVLIFGLVAFPASNSTADEDNQTKRFSVSLMKSETVQAPASTVPSSQQRARVLDCIRQGDALQGTLLDRSGKAVNGVELQMQNARGEFKLARTDALGRFVFRGVSSGVYVVQPRVTPDGKLSSTAQRDYQTSQWIRVWDKKSAPPAAAERFLAVTDGTIFRGQCCANAGVLATCDQCGECMDCCDGCGAGGCGPGGFGVGRVVQAALDNPWMVAAGTAAAIAIPIAANDDDVRSGDDTDAVGGSGEAEDAS